MPTPQPDSKLEALEERKITTVEVFNPSIAPIDSRKSLKVLLSRNTRIEQHAIHLRGVRLIEIPLGWRLMLIRLTSRLFRTRLPDEIEFDSLRIETRNIPASVFDGETIVGRMSRPNALIQLTGGDYLSLCEMNGRALYRWIVDRFDERGTRHRPAGHFRAA